MLNALFKKIPTQGTPSMGFAFQTADGFSIPLIHDVTINENSLEVQLKEFTNNTYKMNASVFMALDILIIMHMQFPTSQNLSLDLDTYMKMRGHSDRYYARKELNNALKALSNIIITYKTNASYYTDLVNVPIFAGDVCIRKSNVKGEFSQAFKQHLQEAMTMDYPAGIFKFSVKKNPFSYAFTRKMLEHAHMNKKKKNKNIVTIQTLFDVHPSLMPYLDFINSQPGDFRKKVMNPILRDLQATGRVVEILDFAREPIANIEGIMQHQFGTLFIKFTST